MDLIYLNSDLLEQGVLENAVLDSEVGGYYDFTLTVPKKYYSVLAGCFVYPKGAIEFGGKIISCVSVSNEGFVTFYGKTWLGMLAFQNDCAFSWGSNPNHKLENYLNSIFSKVGNRIVPSTDYELDDTPTLPEKTDDVYVYLDILRSLMEQAGKLPVISAQYGNDGKMKVKFEVRSPIEYNQADYSSDVIPIEVEKQYVPVRSVTAYKASNLSVVPKTIVMQNDGTWQTGSHYTFFEGFFGRQIAVSLEDDEFANPDWDAIIESVQVKDSASVSNVNTLVPDVGDIVTGRDETTGISATETVKSKSLHLENGIPIFSFDTE